MRVKKLAIGLLATSLCIGCMGMSYGTLGDELVFCEMSSDSLETFASNLSVLDDEFCDWGNAQIVLKDEEYAYTAEGNNCSLYYVVHDMLHGIHPKIRCYMRLAQEDHLCLAMQQAASLVQMWDT